MPLVRIVHNLDCLINICVENHQLFVCARQDADLGSGTSVVQSEGGDRVSSTWVLERLEELVEATLLQSFDIVELLARG